MRFVPPAAFPDTVTGKFRDAVSGVYPGSFIPAEFPNSVMDELINLIVTANIAPTNTDMTQLLQAVRAQRPNYFAAAGTANALTITPVPTFPNWNLMVGVPLNILVASTNTGPATLTVTTLSGTYPITRPGGGAVQAGDLQAGSIIRVMFNGISAEMAGQRLAPQSVIVRFQTPGTNQFVVPAGIYRARSEIWSAGGGAGYQGVTTDTTSPPGGAPGSYGMRDWDVVPGQIIPLVVGAGGVGGTSVSAPGQAGGASSVTVGGITMMALGGAGGVSITAANQTYNAPAAGAVTNADYSIIGGYGGMGYKFPNGTAHGGAGGAAPLGGIGGPGGQGASGGNGVAPGGAGGATSIGGAAGGNGARGEVVFTYFKA